MGKKMFRYCIDVRRSKQIWSANICEENQYQTCMEPAEKRETKSQKKG